MEDIISKIAIAKADKRKELNLSCCELNRIPIEVFDLENLETLKLMYNQITEIPIEIAKLKNLKNLYLSYNKIKAIPEKTLIEMPYIECFDLAENPFDYLTAINFHRDNNMRIGYHEFYKELYAYNNSEQQSFSYYRRLKSFPVEVFELDNLERLSLNCRGIKEIPLGLSRLKKLRYIDLSNNQISNLPDDFWNLENLEVIVLNSNDFKVFPERILDFPKLRTLHISNNKIKVLDKRIFKLENIKNFCALENPFENFDSDLFNYDYEVLRKEYS